MELRYLKYFLAVAETSSFTQAAADCFVAQSALSQQIARLESEVGTRLFHRTSRSVRLTAAGQLLVPLARRILAEVDNARTELDALDGLRRGRLRLGLIQTAGGAADMVAVLGEYRRRYPGIELNVRNAPSAEMVAAVAEGTLDLAVVGLVADRATPAGLVRRVLARDPLVVVVCGGHPLAGRGRIELSELTSATAEHATLIQGARGTGLRHQVEAAFARAGLVADQSFEIGQIHDMVKLAAAGVGATVVPRSAVHGPGSFEPLTEGAAVLELTDPAAVHEVAVVYDSERLAPAAAAFLRVLGAGDPGGLGEPGEPGEPSGDQSL
ncbi:LysR family transcriptional regulator [Kitasatospora kifunensis]|uniref:DNA-binding transcriptional LysR family regulator n=1 Tax=Kitasatospora kifunensis TaxID=58351 RepID=A0A7W7R735_KITKI|nr:LysR family transcriptional regulator [Kitasatospora kifunensis]MBB4926318.1 DNA-binding transcriptional LysR family regulator [Kitasatospora kifunensis]